MILLANDYAVAQSSTPFEDSKLSNGNPADPYSITSMTTSGYNLVAYLLDTETPISIFALFGLDEQLIGSTIEVRRQDTVFSGSDYTATSNRIIDDLEINDKNLYIPITDFIDATNDNYYRYWCIRIIPLNNLTNVYIGEIAMGFAHQPRLNYNYGRPLSNLSNVNKKRTIGNVIYTNRINENPITNIEFSWDSDANDQHIYNLKKVWEDSENGNLPLILVPDTEDRKTVFYGRLGSEFSETEAFFNLNATSLLFEESVNYEVL